MSAPDVPASRLRGKLHPDAARLKYITCIVADDQTRCQVCCGLAGRGEIVVILEPEVDRSNGQRISIALCRKCVWFSGAAEEESPVQTRLKRPRRARKEPPP